MPGSRALVETFRWNVSALRKDAPAGRLYLPMPFCAGRTPRLGVTR